MCHNKLMRNSNKDVFVVKQQCIHSDWNSYNLLEVCESPSARYTSKFAPRMLTFLGGFQGYPAVCQNVG